MLSCRLKRPRHPARPSHAGYSPVACSPRSSAAASRQQIADPPRAEFGPFRSRLSQTSSCVPGACFGFSISYRLVPSACLFFLFFLFSSFIFVSPSCFSPSSLLPSALYSRLIDRRRHYHCAIFLFLPPGLQPAAAILYKPCCVGANSGVTNTPTASARPSRDIIMPLTANNVFSSPSWRLLLWTLTP